MATKEKKMKNTEATKGTGTEKELFPSTGIAESFFDLTYYPTATMKLKTTVYVIACV
jgi:hypothetical protein